MKFVHRRASLSRCQRAVRQTRRGADSIQRGLKLAGIRCEFHNFFRPPDESILCWFSEIERKVEATKQQSRAGRQRHPARAGDHFDVGQFFVVEFKSKGNIAMQIDIPAAEAEKLERQAAAAGFDSAEKYVTEFVLTLAERPDALELFAPMTDDELAASLAMIDRGMEDARAGRTRPAKAALQEIADEFGLKIKQ
jgi:hypothetical protein